jgi:uncharacterized protein YyaL (SSP411 family)
MRQNLLLIIAFLTLCNLYGQKPEPMTHKHTNALINETSPYLLQHAHNPVNWEAWSPEVLKKAQSENKLLLISIGYAACHWCHVMEHECFEDEAVAKVMNDNFICIKVDREERPDVDHIYMDALQMMTGSGGWPLNIVALPNGHPFWGGTYVQKDNWIKVLQQLSELYKKDPQKISDYAQNLAEGIKSINLVAVDEKAEIMSFEQIQKAVKDWSGYFDTTMGGYKQAPKFMMPVNLNFLLHYGKSGNDQKTLEYVNTTLTKMAWGGVFDHIAGGFSRYSVDAKWHVPHFEKMLYDNGQLVSLYSKAYAATKIELYKETVEKTIDFVTNELMDENCGFYSSLDADSLNDSGELEEGAYYVWKEAMLQQLLGGDFEIFKEYYNINGYGLWEHGNYVLIRNATDQEIAKRHHIEVPKLHAILERCRTLLHKERAKRSRPRLDDKILTSWNGLMLKGLVDAYRYLGDTSYLDLALENAAFIEKRLTTPDGGLFHNYKNERSTINGYLEDYASVIDAYIALYEVTFDETWLQRAKTLAQYCEKNFYDPKSGLFFFTSQKDDYVIRRTLETMDNVIPSSNSIMAKDLFKLSKFFPEDGFEDRSLQMLKSLQGNIVENAQSHSNWMQLTLYFDQPFYEVAIVGESFIKKAKQLDGHYLPNAIFAGTAKQNSSLSILLDRYSKGETWIYVCQHGSCKLPVSEPEEVLKQLRYPLEN